MLTAIVVALNTTFGSNTTALLSKLFTVITSTLARLTSVALTVA